jgi:hypothetical protein
MEETETKLDPRATLKNILLILQRDPGAYRYFGIWWWPVKALLRATFGKQQLHILGNYEDPDGASRVPELPIEETLRAALKEFAINSRYPAPVNPVFDTEGEPYTLFDEDVGL